jgi:hypothetical protein
MLSVVALVMLALTPAALGDPPGNNGTVKIDGVAFDDHPDNEPHVGCVFQIDFYGFDQGNLSAQVTIDAQAPTKGGQIYTNSIAIGEDAAGGGTDLDASLTVDLSNALVGIKPHPQQGFHLKLTVNAEGSIGADTKHKVFWVTGCVPTTSTTTTTKATTTTTKATTTTKPTTTTTTKATTTTTIKPGGPGTIIIEKYAQPYGDTPFSFTGTLGGFSIVDATIGTGNPGSQMTFANLAPGVYEVSELVPYGWTLAGISCSVTGDNPTSRVNEAQHEPKVTIHLEAGDTVYCDFLNRLAPQT